MNVRLKSFEVQEDKKGGLMDGYLSEIIITVESMVDPDILYNYIENIWYKKLKFPDQLALPNELIFYKLTKRKDLFKFRFPLENYTKEIDTYAFMMFTWNLIAWLNSINLLED